MFFILIYLYKTINLIPKPSGYDAESINVLVRKQAIKILNESNKKILIAKSELIMPRENYYFDMPTGIKNDKSNQLNYQIRIVPISLNNNQTFDIDNPPWSIYPKTIYKLKSNSIDVINVRLKIPTNAVNGSYVVAFQVIDTELNMIYAQQNILIFVK